MFIFGFYVPLLLPSFLHPPRLHSELLCSIKPPEGATRATALPCPPHHTEHPVSLRALRMWRDGPPAAASASESSPPNSSSESLGAGKESDGEPLTPPTVTCPVANTGASHGSTPPSPGDARHSLGSEEVSLCAQLCLCGS